MEHLDRKVRPRLDHDRAAIVRNELVEAAEQTRHQAFCLRVEVSRPQLQRALQSIPFGGDLSRIRPLALIVTVGMERVAVCIVGLPGGSPAGKTVGVCPLFERGCRRVQGRALARRGAGGGGADFVGRERSEDGPSKLGAPPILAPSGSPAQGLSHADGLPRCRTGASRRPRPSPPLRSAGDRVAGFGNAGLRGRSGSGISGHGPKSANRRKEGLCLQTK